jgi:hypothetical protein
MNTANEVDISKADAPKAELIDIVTTEVSLVDRAANKRDFLVKKQAQAAGEAPTINPLLAPDAEMIAKDKADAEAYKAEKAAAEAAAAGTPVAVTPAATPAVEAAPAVAAASVTAAEVTKTEDIAPTVAVEATTTVVASEVVAPPSVVPAIEAPTTKDDSGEAEPPLQISVSLSPPAPEPLKILPPLKAALEAGLQAVIARAQDALKILSTAVADSSGCSYVPWEIGAQTRQIDALVDQMDCIGGTDWAASAILAAGAASAPTDVTKAGAAMSAARHGRFTKTHGDMGSALKDMQKCYKAMGDMLSEVAPGDKTEKAEVPVVAPAAAPTPVAAPTPAVAPAPVAEVAKSASSDTAQLLKAVEDLRRVVADQALVIEKAHLPQSSNAIPLARTGPNSATIKTEDTGWLPDMAPAARKSNTKF